MQILHSYFVVYLIQSKEVLSFHKSFKQPIQHPSLLGLNHHFKLTHMSTNVRSRW